jgi:hypothetical protein
VRLRFARWVGSVAGSLCAWAWSMEPWHACEDCEHDYQGDDCSFCADKADRRDRWEFEADTRAEHEARWG